MPARTSSPEIARKFSALGHEARVDIVRLLLAAHPDGLVVAEILEALGTPPSTLSHHLYAWRHEGLVAQEREGRFLRYRAGTAALQSLLDFLYAECCTRSRAIPASQVVTIGRGKN